LEVLSVAIARGEIKYGDIMADTTTPTSRFVITAVVASTPCCQRILPE